MKTLFSLPLLLLASHAAQAQSPAPSLQPAVGPGTTFAYMLDLHGQRAPFELTVARAADTLQLSWQIRGLALGSYLVSPAAWQQADRLNSAQPVPGPAVRLPANQTFMMLSKKAFAGLLARHRCVYDNTVYELKADAPPLLLRGQPLDALHLVAQEDATELWILNNPAFPVICRMLHNPLGVDYVLNGIKQEAGTR
ncbi:hypothetical protein [Hymenobacter terricola]|uniref:hypothetical protein n=1 Tax=Hymenobacter terricola TaxID=2819236 RepID=UPI001B3137F4|nr:hypothetical protein [Hymenobacter terricola]